MRSLEEIQQSMIAALAASNSPVDDLSPGSVLSTLIRAASSTVLEQENRLDEVKSQLNPAQLQGTYLSDYALSFYNIRRKPGSLAKGYAILSTNSEAAINISTGSVLTHLETGLQFLITEGPFQVSSTVDVTVPIVSTSTDYNANLPPNAPLYVSGTDASLPQVNAVVGYERSPDGAVCGGLSGGAPQETDRALRQRIKESQLGFGPSLPAILSQEVGINRAWVVTEAPGFVKIYLDMDAPLTPEFESILITRIKGYLPPGIYADFERAKLHPVDISLQAVAFPNTTPDNDIRETLELYFGSFEPGTVVHPAGILAVARPFVRSVSVITPARVLELDAGSLPSLGQLRICYE